MNRKTPADTETIENAKEYGKFANESKNARKSKVSKNQNEFDKVYYKSNLL